MGINWSDSEMNLFQDFKGLILRRRKVSKPKWKHTTKLKENWKQKMCEKNIEHFQNRIATQPI